MGLEGMFGGTISTLEKSLDLRSLQHNLIISNIANKDTPNYKAFDIAVEEELQKMGESEGNIGLLRTDPSHISVNGTNNMDAAVTQTTPSNQFDNNFDGNTVDIEREMVNLAENSLMYDAMAQIIRRKFQGLNSAIQGGAR